MRKKREPWLSPRYIRFRVTNVRSTTGVDLTFLVVSKTQYNQIFFKIILTYENFPYYAKFTLYQTLIDILCRNMSRYLASLLLVPAGADDTRRQLVTVIVTQVTEDIRCCLYKWCFTCLHSGSEKKINWGFWHLNVASYLSYILCRLTMIKTHKLEKISNSAKKTKNIERLLSRQTLKCFHRRN